MKLNRPTRLATLVAIVLAVIALGAEFLITALENRLITWRPARRDDVAL